MKPFIKKVKEAKKRNYLHDKKIVITGGLGFIGTKLIEKIKENYAITILDNSKYINKLKNVKFYKCDLTNYKSLKKLSLKI